jgi:hypothetical protein
MTGDVEHAAKRLAHARILLSREPQLGPGVRRAAALVGRQALEELLAGLWHRHTLDDMADAPMRTQLLCLRDYLADELVGNIAWAWATLSTMAHSLGYTLLPARREVTRCLDTIEELYSDMALGDSALNST